MTIVRWQTEQHLIGSAPNWNFATPFDNGGVFAVPNGAASASTTALRANLMKFATLAQAQFVTEMIAETAGSGAALAACDDNFTNIQWLGLWSYPDVTGAPRTVGTTCTADLNALIGADAYKHLAAMYVGKGKVYRASLQLVWQVEIPNVAPLLESLSASVVDLTDRVDAIEAALAALNGGGCGDPPPQSSGGETITVVDGNGKSVTIAIGEAA